MSIKETLYTHLTGHAGLSALISTRLYPRHLPQNPVYPAVTYERISTPRIKVMGGVSGIAYPRFTFTAWSDDVDECDAVAEQLRAALDAYWGTVDGTEIKYSSTEDESDAEYDEDVGAYASEVDFIIWHEET